jgi:outer membrane receptor protein involved in Fe transport
VTPDINVYANVGTGFRSGGFNTLANVQRGAPAAFDPETAIFYEIGSKGRAFDSRLNYSVAGFIGKFRDQFQDFIDLNPPDAATNGPLQYTINGGSSRIRGIEWDFTLRASPSLRLSFAGDIMSAKFTKVSNAAGIAVGSRVDNVPKYDLNFSADYDFQWRRSVPGFFNITYSRKGPQSIQDGALAPNPIAPPTYIPALDFLQASIGADVGGMTITLFGRNLLDERKPLSASTDGTAAQARPRQIGISLAKTF